MRREKIILQRKLVEKKYPARQVARKKNSCWPEITSPSPPPPPPPQKLNWVYPL